MQTDKEILELIKNQLVYHQIIWHDGERYQLKGCRQELYAFLYELREVLNDRSTEVKQ